jgi:YidC/Oxa1 family membrane protein insertase
MKNKKIKITAILIFTLFLSGCAVRMTDENKKPVINEETGQQLVENILCQPQEDQIKQQYKDNGVDITQLPKCEDFSVLPDVYEGIWTTVFVRPLVWMIIQIGKLLNNYGLSIIISTLLIRFLMSPLTKKSADQSEKMKKAKTDLDYLETKYKDKKDQESIVKRNEETVLIYKKHGINPATGCLFSVIQIPLFFAYYESISRLPAVFEETFLTFKLGTDPVTAITNGQYQYIIFIVLIILTTYYSFKLVGTTAGTEDQAKQMKTMMNFMVIMIFVASLNLPTGLALYWITNSTFTIGQNLLSKRRVKV